MHTTLYECLHPNATKMCVFCDAACSQHRIHSMRASMQMIRCPRETQPHCHVCVLCAATCTQHCMTTTCGLIPVMRQRTHSPLACRSRQKHIWDRNGSSNPKLSTPLRAQVSRPCAQVLRPRAQVSRPCAQVLRSSACEKRKRSPFVLEQAQELKNKWCSKGPSNPKRHPKRHLYVLRP